MKIKFAISVIATRIGETSHSVFMVEATSKDEATGMGLRIALKAYKKDQGWRDHDVTVCLDTHVLNPNQMLGITIL